jgi:hypothetical protein
MPKFDIGGGIFPSDSQQTLASFVGYRGVYQEISTPAGRTTAAGTNPILFYAINMNVSGYDSGFTSINITIGERTTPGPTYNGSQTGFFSVGQANRAPATGEIGFDSPRYFSGPSSTILSLNNSSFDKFFRFRRTSPNIYSDPIYVYNSSFGNQGITYSQSLRGQGSYYESPTAPQSLTQTAVNPTSIDLSWTAPSSNGDAAIIGYVIQYSLNSNFSNSTSIDVSTSTTRTVTVPASDRTYYFRVAAKNAVTVAAGTTSLWSNTIIKDSRPNAPTATVSRSGLTYTISGSSTIGDGSVSSYRFSSRSSTDGGATFGDWSSESTIGTSSYSTTFLSTIATSYQFRVRSISATSLFSEYFTTDTFHTPNVPLLPSAEIVLTKNVRKVNIDWDPFTTNQNIITEYNGASITSYQLEERYSSDNGTNWSSWVNISSPPFATTVFLTNDLLIAKTYQFRVRAVSDVGNSAYQQSSSIFISAYGSRATGPTTFVSIENAKIFLGVGQPGTDPDGWRIVENLKRFDGSAWTDLQT